MAELSMALPLAQVAGKLYNKLTVQGH